MARALKSNAVVDEFTSVVDRNVAKALSNSIRKYVDRKGLKNIVLVGCHYDVIRISKILIGFLIQKLRALSGRKGMLQAVDHQLLLSVRKADKESWGVFKEPSLFNK